MMGKSIEHEKHGETGAHFVKRSWILGHQDESIESKIRILVL